MRIWCHVLKRLACSNALGTYIYGSVRMPITAGNNQPHPFASRISNVLVAPNASGKDYSR